LAEQNSSSTNGKTRNALIVGAGDAGALVVRELQRSSQLNLSPVGFLDDDQAKQDQEIYGVRVIGKLSDLASILEKRHVDEVIIAIPTAPGTVVRMISEVCRIHNTPSRTMPGIYELIGGQVNVSRLREVEISDLLRREPAKVDDALVGTSFRDKRVLVTGAGGSIGREICRQVARWNPAELVILGHGENSIFETLLELQEDFPGLTLHPVIADIRDQPRIQNIFEVHRPDVVFHAAAHKHVPLMEINPEEAITNNVIGTRNVVQVAIDTGVERFVLISTDKAVKPINVYGATKRLAEMIVIDAAQRTNRIFTVVRFGNVLGSRGSVVPIFKSQIARGGPILVTHPEMERYFMIIPEAVHLVLQAAAMGQGGEAFILNMGEQVRILELAEDLIRLSGLEPERDIEIVFTGIRSGEKLSEDLWEQGANFQPTSHAEIFRSKEDEEVDREGLIKAIDQLEHLSQAGDVEAITSLLDEIVPGASIRFTPPPDLISIV
jgi:FlaA1/EpsC-like NDP-sugar epimerase